MKRLVLQVFSSIHQVVTSSTPEMGVMIAGKRVEDAGVEPHHAQLHTSIREQHRRDLSEEGDKRNSYGKPN